MRRRKLSTFDATGGVILGAFAGVAVVWVLGAVALLLPGQTDLRRGAQGSALLQRLNKFIPPTEVLNALARIDPFPAITGPAASVAPPDPSLAHAVGVRRATPSVVRVLGMACGIGVEGTGWVAKQDLIVTAAHVVAGQSDTVSSCNPAGDCPPMWSRSIVTTTLRCCAHGTLVYALCPWLPRRQVPPWRCSAFRRTGRSP